MKIMADKNRGQERKIGQNRGQEQQQGRGLEQERENVGNLQGPQTHKSSRGIDQQGGRQQQENISEGGMGYGRSGEPDSDVLREESGGSRGGSL